MIHEIREKVARGAHRFTIHALERCVERNIPPKEIKNVILSGEVIESYPKDKYGPSSLICGMTESGRILHVHCSINPVWIITAYDPTMNSENWDENFKKRRMPR